MEQYKYIIFSKTCWADQPRLRHHLAHLLGERGAKILFFEKPYHLFFKRKDSNLELPNWLTAVRTRELVNHQLRVSKPLTWLNAFFEKRQIKKVISKFDTKNSVIVNFNYDYAFLRNIFPMHKIVTIINDDFVAQAKFLKGAHTMSALRETCLKSDAVLVVSHPLAEQVSSWCNPHLFLPWSDCNYRSPDSNGNRNAVLIWAHIDRRINFNLLEQVALNRPDIDFHIAGPVIASQQSNVSRLSNLAANIHIKGALKLDKTPLTSYFCSAIPYKSGVRDIEAVTMSNKTLQLLARGMPIVTCGMPNFYSHDAIIKTKDVEEFISALDFCRENFSALQPSIALLVSQNQSIDRFKQFQRILHDLKEGTTNV